MFYVCEEKQQQKNVLVGEVIVEHVNHFDNYIQLLRHHQVEKMLEDYLQARQAEKNNNLNNNTTKSTTKCKTTSEQQHTKSQQTTTNL
jgi:hypothetical protein